MSKRNRNRKHSISPVARKTNADVDVVITTGGRWDFLKECLDALKKQTVKINVIIFDNGTEQDERNEHQDLFEGVTSKRVHKRVGFPLSNNEAAKLGSAPYILFLNDDCILFENAIEEMLKIYSVTPQVGIVGAKLMFPLTSTSPIRPAGKIQHIGMMVNIRGDVQHALIAWSQDHPKCCVTRDVLAVTGACLMIRRDLFRQLNGFDLVYGDGTFEDVDICLRARQNGYRVLVNADAKGYHYAGATSEQKKTPFPIMQNSMIFKNRWVGTPFLAWDEWSYY